jgi:uncharacterized DUF497 family protein
LVYWQNFDPEHFDYEFDEDELGRHGVTIDEAVEVIWGRFDVNRNKRPNTGYQLIGRTDGGRTLKLIVYEKGHGVIRVITGWAV